MPVTLPWYPPAPASGPASVLSLPPDDWVMQPKIDGIRVIIYGGEPFNRLGQPLSESKGAGVLRSMFNSLDVTLDGEWVPHERKYYAFDLPDEAGDYDHRAEALLAALSWKVPGLVIVENHATQF